MIDIFFIPKHDLYLSAPTYDSNNEHQFIHLLSAKSIKKKQNDNSVSYMYIETNDQNRQVFKMKNKLISVSWNPVNL